MKIISAKHIIFLLFFSVLPYQLYTSQLTTTINQEVKNQKIILFYQGEGSTTKELTTDFNIISTSTTLGTMIDDLRASSEDTLTILLNNQQFPCEHIEKLLPLMQIIANNPHKNQKNNIKNAINNFYNDYKNNQSNFLLILKTIHQLDIPKLENKLISNIVHKYNEDLFTQTTEEDRKKFLEKIMQQIKINDLSKKIINKMIHLYTITDTKQYSSTKKYTLELSNNCIYIKNSNDIICTIPYHHQTHYLKNVIVGKCDINYYPTFIFSPNDQFLLYCNEKIQTTKPANDKAREERWNCILTNLQTKKNQLF